jgi:predicted AlkP superfamily phosphohydrolase/phosphomutase
VRVRKPNPRDHRVRSCKRQEEAPSNLWAGSDVLTGGPGVPSQPLIVIGLDSATPSYLFDRCLSWMPNLRRLMPHSIRAPLRTTDPPISLPAWAVMCTGVDPGTLGMYGFRHRLDHSYDRTYGPTSDRLPVPTIWQIASDAGLRVAVIGMPPGFPPPKVNGLYISDFLTPPDASNWTYPAELAAEIERTHGTYHFDVTFRASERDQLYREIEQMTQERFAIAEELYQREAWDLFAIHEIGTDRLHHAYTKFFDPAHPSYVPGSPYEHVLEEYYAVLDRALGRLLALRREGTRVVIASDHGSMPMEGCFCINGWLRERGYLRLRAAPAGPTPLERAEVDWPATKVWGAGGYYARLFFNVRGRESQGAIEPSQVPEIRARLLEELRTVCTPAGRPLLTRAFEPKDVYREVRGDPPDLMLYFDNLRWRSAGTLGHPSLFLAENDIGPDDAVHHPNGVFLLHDPGLDGEREADEQRIVDVAPTLLDLLGVPLPPHVQGRPMLLEGWPKRTSLSSARA